MVLHVAVSFRKEQKPCAQHDLLKLDRWLTQVDMLHHLGRSYQWVRTGDIINPEKKTLGCSCIGGYMASFMTFHAHNELLNLPLNGQGAENYSTNSLHQPIFIWNRLLEHSELMMKKLYIFSTSYISQTIIFFTFYSIYIWGICPSIAF